MLRIDVEDSIGGSKLVLLGKLVGPSVDELERSWKALQSATTARLEVDVTRVTSMDDAGKEHVFRMRQAGVKFTGTGLIGRFLCKEIEDKMKSCCGPDYKD